MNSNKRKGAPASVSSVPAKSVLSASGSATSRFGFKPQLAASKDTANKENIGGGNSNQAPEKVDKVDKSLDGCDVAQAQPPSLSNAPTPKKAKIVAQPPLTAAQLVEERERVTSDIQSELMKREGLGAVYQSIFTEETEQEAKKAAQCKVTAAKLNFKDQIAQLNANVKLLKKSLGQELTGRQEFVKKANAIEVFYQLELRDRALRCWDLQQAINTLHAKLVGEERKLSAVECERQKLIGQLRENVSEQEKLDIIVGQYKQEKDELMNQYETLNGQVIEYQAQIDALQSSREHLNRLLTETAAEKAEIAAELKRITAERDELSELIQKQEEEIQSQQEKINSQRELNGELMANYEGALNEIKEIRADKENKEAALQNANDKIRQLQALFEENEEKLKTAITEAENVRCQLATARSQHAAELKAQNEALQGEMNAKLAQKDEELHAVIGELAESRSQGEQLRLQRQHWEAQHQAASLALAELRGQELAHVQKAAQLTGELAKAQAELGVVKVQLDSKSHELTAAIQSFTKANEFHQEVHAKLRSEKEKLELRLQECESEKMAVETALKELRNVHEKTSAELNTANNEIISLKEQKAALESELANEKAAAEKRISEMTANNDRLAAELQRFQDLNAALHKEKEDFKVRASQSQAELDSFKKHAGVSNEAQLSELVKLSVEAEQMRAALEDKGSLLRELEQTKERLKATQLRLGTAEQTRRELHNQLQELRGNIRVYTRVRPHSAEEMKEEKSASALELAGDNRKLKVAAEKGTFQFQFDHVFPPTSSQTDVFEEISPLIQSALDGYQVCLFSYGQTGSGKTHTMTGGSAVDARGIIPRAIEKMLGTVEDLIGQGWSYSLECSFIEIYNEQIRDLLNSKPEDGVKYEIKRDGVTGTTQVTGALKLPVKRQSEIQDILKTAAKNRSVAATKMNEQSSRSHSIFTITLNGSNALTKQTVCGSLSLCDLAGSERLKSSQAEGARLKETQAINKSLSALTDVFTAIGKKASHVPFRNSLLTYYLQPCLSGDGKTIMICNVSGTQASAFETLCSLRFAQQVNQCELGKPKKTVKSEK